LAYTYAPEASSRWHAYLAAYQIIPDQELLRVEEVALQQTVQEIISRPGARAICESCGEEIINERELIVDERVLCRTCAAGGYYHTL
jgi:formylmethanofuran dehydrogenase subunit E